MSDRAYRVALFLVVGLWATLWVLIWYTLSLFPLVLTQ